MLAHRDELQAAARAVGAAAECDVPAAPAEATYQLVSAPRSVHAEIRGEQAAIRKYESQLRWIGDENVRANLRRILADERCHLELFRQRWQEHMDRRR